MLPPDHAHRLARARTALEGLSLGDAFGERFFLPPATAISMIDARALPKPPWPWTDDTAMATSIYEVLASKGRVDQDALAAAFARRYAEQPARGYGGMAHELLAAIGQGMPWREVSSSAFGGTGSMGNGGAMRVAPAGAYFADDLARAAEEARASAEVTHAHPEGQSGAIAAAVAAGWAAAAQHGAGALDPQAMFEAVLARTPAGGTRDGIEEAARTPLETEVWVVAEKLGSGGRVIAQDTVPFALWCAARHLEDFEAAMWSTVAGLGDRDTTCAIAGGIVAFTTRRPMPAEWLAAREPLEV